MRSIVLLGLAAFLALPAGCIFSPDECEDCNGGPPPPPAYEIPAYPYLVLRNLVTAYEARDSVQCKLIYDPSYYEGKSTNVNDPDPATQVSTFLWADEVAHVAGMARSSEITDVTMDLGPETTWYREASDILAHPEWALIQRLNYYSITIYATNKDYLLQWDPGDQMKFYFTPTTPAASSPSDTLWSIVYWEEVGAEKPEETGP